MKRNPWIFGIIGLLTGTVVTALWILFTAEAAPQGNLFGSQTKSEATISPATLVQNKTDTPPVVPRRLGMMGAVDQRFMVMMVPHHEDAIAMADLALTRAKHPEIKALAQTIKKTQTQENEQMRSWYRQWYGETLPEWEPGSGFGMMGGWNRSASGNQPYPERGQGSGRGFGMGMGMMGMGGGCMRTDLEGLKNATDFDRAFIQEMIPHHEMGVMMAQMAQLNTQRPEIRDLTASIIKSQSAEIEQMEQWYQSWYR